MMQTRKEPPGSFFYCRCRAAGFTIAELVAVLIIIGVIAVVALPRLSTSGFDEVRFYDETSAALRYAQATAVTTQRMVCVTSTGTQMTLMYSSAYEPPACDTALAPPGGGGAPYTVTAQGSAGSPAFSFTFDRVGRPSAPQTINLNGGRQILVEAETGYVH